MDAGAWPHASYLAVLAGYAVLLSYLPYALLLAATALDVGTRGGLSRAALIDVGLAAATAAWMLWWGTLHPQWTEAFDRGLLTPGAR